MKVSIAKRVPYVPAVLNALLSMPLIPVLAHYFPAVIHVRLGLLLLWAGGLLAALPITAAMLFLWVLYESR